MLQGAAVTSRPYARGFPAAAAVLLLLLPSPSAACKEKADCVEERCDSLGCLRTQVLCLLDKKDADGAVSLLKERKDEFGGERVFVLLLAKSYMRQGNTFWALRTLDEHLALHPGDCVVRSWVIWIKIAGAEMDEARELLDDETCLAGAADVSLRYGLLATFIDVQTGQDGDATTKAFLEKKVGRIFEEDIDLYRTMRSALFPYGVPLLTLKLDLASGYTTNATFGSPGDPVNIGKRKDSALFSHDVLVGLAPAISPWLLLQGEITSRSSVYVMEDAREFTTVDLGWRAGPLLFMTPETFPRLFLGYRGDVLFLNRGDRFDETQPIVFYEGHRAELEFSLMPSVMLFGGMGKRIFRELPRTRWEMDGGLALQMTILGRLTLQGALAVRHHMGNEEAYDLFGASGLAMGSLSIWKGLRLTTLVALHGDNYLDSLGYFQPGKTRRDATLKLAAEILGYLGKGIELSVGYEFSSRLSTVEDYRFTDHRFLVKLSFSYGLDFLSLKKSGGTMHVPLDYGLGAKGEGAVKKIQDLLREEETIQGGASCGCRE